MDQKPSSVTVTTTGGAALLDAKGLEKIRDILHHLANTVSAMKIFPSEHATVRTFIDDLVQKLNTFLEAYGKVEIGIAEYSFVSGGRPVYTDEMTIKSLPFFFFKDGMQMLYFYQGLDRDEVLGFLELIKSESQKPAGESDIVTALWERDFANIQYYAPDDFLENRIVEERAESRAKAGVPVMPEFAHEVIEVKVDTSKFTSGTIELLPQDREDVRRRSAVPGIDEQDEPRVSVEEPAAEGAEEMRRSPAASMDPTLTEPELERLESLVRRNRTISPDAEFLNLMVEILNLETDAASFGADVDILLEFHLEQLQQGNFAFAVPLIHGVRELRDHLAASDPGKSACLDEFLQKIISPKTVEAIKQLLDKKKAVDWNALVDFFALLGKPALPLAAEVYETVPEAAAREKVLGFILAVSRDDLGGLASLAADERPLLSKAIIGHLGGEAGKKGLPHLGSFLGFRTKEIKLAAIQALGEAKDEIGNRILLGFLKDGDEDLRIQAAMRLNPVEQSSRIRTVIADASSPPFQAKSLKEKEAILSFIGRTRTSEGLEFLRSTLLKRRLWTTPRAREMKVAAATGLENMGTDEAVRALEKGAGSRNAEVREACSQGLARLARKRVGGR